YCSALAGWSQSTLQRYLILTADGCLLMSRDAVSPPDHMVALQGGCEAIVEGREILDLPKLPSGGRRDCCFALILPQEKFLLLLADNAENCRWVGRTTEPGQGWV
uniref:PH domain-containing protein n=1 Tax=Esox lucius TaxID=8010 RepID=A0A6Q2ZIJ4_ESOLU